MTIIMKFIKNNGTAFSLFAIAIISIVGIFVYPSLKDVFTALITVCIPTAIVALEMKKNKDQFSASNKLNKISEIRTQGAKLIEALNQNELIKLQNDFNEECKRVIYGSYFFSKPLLASVKPIFDKFTVEWLKLDLLLPRDESGMNLRNDLTKWTKIFENSLQDFQTIICYMSEKSPDQMTYHDFNNYYSASKSIAFDLKQWTDDRNVIGLLQKKNDKEEVPAIEAINKFTNYILDNPSNRDYQSDVQSIVLDILSNYCNTKEKEILNS